MADDQPQQDPQSSTGQEHRRTASETSGGAQSSGFRTIDPRRFRPKSLDEDSHLSAEDIVDFRIWHSSPAELEARAVRTMHQISRRFFSRRYDEGSTSRIPPPIAPEQPSQSLEHLVPIEILKSNTGKKFTSRQMAGMDDPTLTEEILNVWRQPEYSTQEETKSEHLLIKFQREYPHLIARLEQLIFPNGTKLPKTGKAEDFCFEDQVNGQIVILRNPLILRATATAESLDGIAESETSSTLGPSPQSVQADAVVITTNALEYTSEMKDLINASGVSKQSAQDGLDGAVATTTNALQHISDGADLTSHTSSSSSTDDISIPDHPQGKMQDSRFIQRLDLMRERMLLESFTSRSPPNELSEQPSEPDSPDRQYPQYLEDIREAYSQLVQPTAVNSNSTRQAPQGQQQSSGTVHVTSDATEVPSLDAGTIHTTQSPSEAGASHVGADNDPGEDPPQPAEQEAGHGSGTQPATEVEDYFSSSEGSDWSGLDNWMSLAIGSSRSSLAGQERSSITDASTPNELHGYDTSRELHDRNRSYTWSAQKGSRTTTLVHHSEQTEAVSQSEVLSQSHRQTSSVAESAKSDAQPRARVTRRGVVRTVVKRRSATFRGRKSPRNSNIPSVRRDRSIEAGCGKGSIQGGTCTSGPVDYEEQVKAEPQVEIPRQLLQQDFNANTAESTEASEPDDSLRARAIRRHVVRTVKRRSATFKGRKSARSSNTSSVRSDGSSEAGSGQDATQGEACTSTPVDHVEQTEAEPQAKVPSQSQRQDSKANAAESKEPAEPTETNAQPSARAIRSTRRAGRKVVKRKKASFQHRKSVRHWQTPDIQVHGEESSVAGDGENACQATAKWTWSVTRRRWE